MRPANTVLPMAAKGSEPRLGGATKVPMALPNPYWQGHTSPKLGGHVTYQPPSPSRPPATHTHLSLVILIKTLQSSVLLFSHFTDKNTEA